MTFAFDCKSYEAQVRGTITSATMIQDGVCQYEVQIHDMQDHMLCPLGDVNTPVKEATLNSCSHAVGDEFYSILASDETGENIYFVKH